MNSIKTIRKSVSAEIIEKKSRFIANIYNVNSKEEAESKITEIKKKYYDAKHNCFAYSVFEDNQQLLKMSDDGEPSGTAGEPILNIIQKNNLNNILIIVTRYFGGILLGTGGLLRAYSNASLKALEKAKIVEFENGEVLEIEINYANNSGFKYYCNKNNIKITNIEYKQNIIYTIELNEEKANKILDNIKSKKGNELPNIENIVVKCQKMTEKQEQL